MVLPCGYRRNSLPILGRIHRRRRFRVPAKAPHWKASTSTSIRHAAPSTFIFKDLATSSYVFLWHGAVWGTLQARYVRPYRMIRPIKSTFRFLRRQSPLTAWNRRMSSMFTQNPLPRRPFVPVSRLAPDGGCAFRITWGCSGISGGMLVWWMPQANLPT